MAIDYATPLIPGLPNRRIGQGGGGGGFLPNRTIRPGSMTGNAPQSLLQFILQMMNPQAQSGFTPLNLFGGRNVGSASMGGQPTNFNFNMGPYQGKFTQQPPRLQATSFNMPNKQAGLMPFNNLLTQMMFQPQGFQQQVGSYVNQPRIAQSGGGFGSGVIGGSLNY